MIALLLAVAYGWTQENTAQNAAEISRLGKELYKRLAYMSGHWDRLGTSLARAVEAYNEATGSLESRGLGRLGAVIEQTARSQEEHGKKRKEDRPPAPVLLSGRQGRRNGFRRSF